MTGGRCQFKFAKTGFGWYLTTKQIARTEYYLYKD
jgi:hypothetical protein